LEASGTSQYDHEPQEQSAHIPDGEAYFGKETEGGLFGVIAAIGGVSSKLTGRLRNYFALTDAQLLATGGASLSPTRANSVPPGLVAREISSKNVTDLISTHAEIESAKTRLGLRGTRETSFQAPVSLDLPRIQNSPSIRSARTPLKLGSSIVTSMVLPGFGNSEIDRIGHAPADNEKTSILDLPELAVEHRASDGTLTESEIEDTDHLRLKISRILADEVRRYLASE